MLTFYAKAPALPPFAFRRLELLCFLLWVALGGAVGLLSKPGLMGLGLFLGGWLLMNYAIEVTLRCWARRRALPLVPRREWRAVWRDATCAAPVPWFFARGLLFSVAMVQVVQGRPAWTLDANGWFGVAVFAVFGFLMGLWNRGRLEADAWAAAEREAAPGPERDAA